MKQAKLYIVLLGGLTVSLGERAVTGFASRKVEALLVYLACNPRTHPRETLAALLWPENDQNRALANLSVALSSLRKQLGTAVVADRHTVGFNEEIECELDTAVFQQAITQVREQQKQRGKLGRSIAQQLATAVSLYKGDFLAGFHVRGVPEFEAWVLLEQERLRQLYLTALADLITYHQQRGQFGEAIAYGQQLLAVDPLQENIHRQLMGLYVQEGQRPAALAQYEQCVRILDEELGVEPDEETVGLYEQIVSGEWGEREQGSRGAGEKSPPHNLPAANNSFIGREAEVARIEAWLMQPDGRLLTITGVGGMGKTRLAQEAARSQIGQFADGVWHVSLVSHTDMNGIITAVAEAIDLTLSGGDEPSQQLLTYLQTREMLLILDNLEHLLSSELLDFITQLTEQAPDLRLIATSRERLRLQAETVLDLGGLPYPEDGNRLSVSRNPITDHRLRFTDYPAVQLFVNRVRRVRDHFQLEVEAAAVGELCQLVGGLPLALELAATWTRILSVAEIVNEIQGSLDALSTTLHDVPLRHRSIRAVIYSSWQMLPEAEQRLFRRLAVFRGGFTRTAATQIASARLPQLMSLVDRSLLRRDSDQRFRRHPLLLQFAQEQLAAYAEEQTQTRADHAHFFADLVQGQAVALQGSEAATTLTALGVDWENIRASWQWALAENDTSVLDKLVTGMGTFLMERGRFREGVSLFGDSFAGLRGKGTNPLPIHAKIQAQLGNFLHEVGDFTAAETHLKEASELAQQHDLLTTRIECLRNLGEVIQDLGDRSRARPHLEEALALCDATPDEHDYQKLLVLNTLGKIEVFEGRYEQARLHFEEAMSLARALGQTFRIASLHNNIAVIANAQEKYEEAIRQYQLAREGFKAQQYERGIAATSLNIGIAYVALEQYEAALPNIQTAYDAYDKLGYKRGMVNALSVMGTICRKQGQRRQARRYFYESLRLAQAVGVSWSALATLVDVAELEMSYGEMEGAVLLLAFAAQHPAIEATTLTKARELLDELRAELPHGAWAGLEAAVATHTLDSMIAQVVDGRDG